MSTSTFGGWGHNTLDYGEGSNSNIPSVGGDSFLGATVAGYHAGQAGQKDLILKSANGAVIGSFRPQDVELARAAQARNPGSVIC